ncbi:MAG TPA: hypothetical protein VNG91_08310 [Terriglobia bacterium]|nr:hypothetical protein [Terriglobia bacterium]
MPKILVEKPSLPTLWVDTAVGIKLAKVERGEAVQDIEKRRMVKLKELVVKLARSCKLLCPEGDQEWEYWGERLDDKISEEFAALSLGALGCYPTKPYMTPSCSLQWELM